MAVLTALWRRLPVVARAVLVGSIVAIAGTGPWALLVAANLRHYSSIPWAVLPTAVYLWLFWRYVRGDGWPRSTAEARRSACRANRLSSEVWGAAVFAGLLGLIAILLLQTVMSRLVVLPQQREIDPTRYPLGTVVAWVLMSALVAGVVEESAFRGYMQGPIERRHGPFVAILITGAAFGFMHFGHREVTLSLMPFYLAVAAVYGGLAWITNSILPGLVLHAGGNMWVAFQLFATGRSEWQPVPETRPLIWESGPDAAFWLALAAAAAMGTATVVAYRALAGTVRREAEA